MGQCVGHLVALHATHRPPQGHLSLLFDNTHFRGEASQYQDLICCPSRHGAHIIFANDSSVLFKVKTHLTHGDHAPRFDIFEVDDKGRAMEISMGYIEKAHTEMSAQRGFFQLSQAWHVGCQKLEMKDRKGVLHPKTSKKLATPSQAWSMDASYELQATRDSKTKAEVWTRKFALADPQYSMRVDNEESSMPNKSVVRVLFRGEQICVGRMQTFHHLGVRGSHERPFLGIRLQATPEHLGRGDTRNVDTSNTPTSTRSPTATWRSGSGSRGTATSRTACGVPGPQILPLLLVLAWGEEAVHPPNDLRDHFVQRMRSKSKGKDKLEKWESGEDGDEQPSAIEVSVVDDILGTRSRNV